jgi:SAM-dependent methyltransferase
LCVDRYYIERFLEANSTDIRGSVLDVHDATYVRRYGGDAVEHFDVLDIDPLNPNATVIADLRDAAGVSSSTYDCVILTQVLQLIDAVPAALRETQRILRPGGVALISVPCVSRVDPEAGLDRDYWRFSRVGLHRLLEGAFPGRSHDVRAWGNRVATLGFLMGLAAEEVGETALDQCDPAFPLVLTARVGPIL